MGRVSEPSNKRKTTATSPARPKKMKGVSAEVDRDPELVTRFLVGLVVLANLPFSTIDNIVFRSFIMYLIPWYKMPSRRTLIRRLDEAYGFATKDYKEKIAPQSFFSATFDLATVMNSSRHFIVITIHYYDKIVGKFHSITVGAQQMLNRSTADEIGAELKKALKIFAIPIEKIGAVCTDGGSNVKKACRDIFGPDKHLICSCHIMDNVIKECFKAVTTLDPHLGALKRLVQFFKQSYVAANTLRNLQIEMLDIKLSQCRMLVQSVPTRWNSVLRAIQRFSELYPFVQKVLEIPDIKKKAPEISDHAVKSLEEVALLIKNFDGMTKKFSSNSTLVSNTVNLDINYLHKSIEAQVVTDPVATEFKQMLLPELNRRFIETKSSTLLAAANLLDPRFKGCGIERSVYEKGARYIKKMVQDKAATCTASNEPRLMINNITSNSSPLLEFFTARTRLQRKLTPQEELSDYLGDPVIEDLDECPINWWNSNKLKYPTLTSVALELLTIPVSSVASERTVSTLNRILSDRRTRLTNVNVNKLVVLISLPFESWESYIGVKFTTLSTSA